MSSSPSFKPGSIAWTDLTVPNAEQVRDFYARVVGWTPSPVEMGGYSDFNMNAEDGTPAAGVCHARGVNQGLPACWMVYIIVKDLDASLHEVRANGGEVLVGPKSMGGQSRYAVIKDPSGACCALFQSNPA